MSEIDLARVRKTYAAFRQPPVMFSGGGGGGGGGGACCNQWNELSPSPRLNTTASVAIAGDLGNSVSAEDKGAFFYVSGSVSNSATQTDASIFEGDVTTYGSVTLENSQTGVSSYTRFISLAGQTGSSTESNLKSSVGVEGIDVTPADSVDPRVHSFVADVVSINDTSFEVFTITTKCVVKVVTGNASIFYKNVLDYRTEMDSDTNVDWVLNGNILNLRVYNSGAMDSMKSVASITHSRLL